MSDEGNTHTSRPLREPVPPTRATAPRAAHSMRTVEQRCGNTGATAGADIAPTPAHATKSARAHTRSATSVMHGTQRTDARVAHSAHRQERTHTSVHEHAVAAAGTADTAGTAERTHAPRVDPAAADALHQVRESTSPRAAVADARAQYARAHTKAHKHNHSSVQSRVPRACGAQQAVRRAAAANRANYDEYDPSDPIIVIDWRSRSNV